MEGAPLPLADALMKGDEVPEEEGCKAVGVNNTLCVRAVVAVAREGEGMPESDGRDEALPEGVCNFVIIKEGALLAVAVTKGERDASGEGETIAESWAVPLTEVIALGVKVALSERIPVPLTMLEGEKVGAIEKVGAADAAPVPLEYTLGEPTADKEGIGEAELDKESKLCVAICERLPKRDSVGWADGEIAALCEAAAETESVEVVEGVTVGVGDPVGVRDCVAVGVKVGLPVFVAVAEGVSDAVPESEPVSEPDCDGVEEGVPVAVGVGE